LGYLACMEGRAATESSQDRSVASEAEELTGGGRSWVTVSSVNIGIDLY
jgi:hypothetical protein